MTSSQYTDWISSTALSAVSKSTSSKSGRKKQSFSTKHYTFSTLINDNETTLMVDTSELHITYKLFCVTVVWDTEQLITSV
jgi:hypothetical protein